MKHANPNVTERLVIEVRHPGLGDHLFYSHIPRIAKKVGCREVLVSSQSLFRHADTKRLTWETNPYVDGFTNEPGLHSPKFQFLPAGMNLLDKLMLDLGVDDGLRYHEPEVFYEPRILPELAHARVFDPNCYSTVGRISDARLREHLD